MNRAALRWALDAVVPHAGRSEWTNVVGLEQTPDFELAAFSTDKYTLAIATVDAGPNVNARMTSQEARELLRFIRPTIRATETEEVVMLVRDLELHVGLVKEDENEAQGEDDDQRSAVFDLITSELRLEDLYGLVDHLDDSPEEFRPQPYRRTLWRRFGSAAQTDDEPMLFIPKHVNDRNGAALVYADHFIGAIAGMAYIEQEKAA